MTTMSLYKLFKRVGRGRKREQEATRLDELAFDELHYYYGYYCYYYNNDNYKSHQFNNNIESRRHRRNLCRKLRKFNIDLWVKERKKRDCGRFFYFTFFSFLNKTNK